MSNDIPAWMLPHRVRVRPYLGDNATGDAYGAQRSRVCVIDEERQLIRTQTGDEQVSETTLRTFLRYADDFAAESEVVVNGTTTRVLKSSRRDSGGIGLGDHLEVNLR